MAHRYGFIEERFFCVLCQGLMTLLPTRSKHPNILYVEPYPERLRIQLRAFKRGCLYNKLKGPKAIRMAGSEMTLQAVKKIIKHIHTLILVLACSAR